MTKRFKELYIDSKGIVSLKDNGILKLGELHELENLLNTLDEKSKGLQVTTELINGGQRMTALYCYMVSFYDYSDSEFRPIFHEKKYTKTEFQKICNEIKAKILEAQENVWSWQYPDRFIEYAKEYGFKEIDILEVETIGFKVTTYGEYE